MGNASNLQNEVAWCIDQLFQSINSGKLSERKGKEYQKTIATLKSPKSSLIRKRQLMRTTLGDYRSKMANDEPKSQLTLSQNRKIPLWKQQLLPELSIIIT